MTWFALLKLVHIASAMWLVGGLLCRYVALRAASRSDDLDSTRAIVDVAGRYENWMVIPGSIAVLLSGLLTAMLGGLPLLGPVQGGASWVPLSLIIFMLALGLLPPLVFLPRGRLFGQALDEAVALGRVSCELRRGRPGSDRRVDGVEAVLTVSHDRYPGSGPVSLGRESGR